MTIICGSLNCLCCMKSRRRTRPTRRTRYFVSESEYDLITREALALKLCRTYAKRSLLINDLQGGVWDNILPKYANDGIFHFVTNFVRESQRTS